MLGEIGRNPKVKELSTNPLMLVILALIRHEQTRLPEERVQLYNRAVNTLMDTWNRGRSLAGIDVGGIRLPLDRLVRVWGAVAEWTRRTKPTGVVHRAELKRKLVEILRDREFDEEDPDATAESYLNAAADRAGLLEERGRDIFAFWHPTFEEFLAAVELTTPSSRAIERLLPLREDPRWREVILLAVGYIGVVQRDGDTATALVEAIWKQAPGPLEPLLHSHLRLAADCVADDVGVKRSLAEKILVHFGEVVWEKPYDALAWKFRELTFALSNLRPTPSTVVALAPLAEHDSVFVWSGLSLLMGNVAAENPEARRICELLLSGKNGYMSPIPALGLVKLSGSYETELWMALDDYNINPELFTDSVDDAKSSLFAMLDGEDPHVRSLAARLLLNLRWVTSDRIEQVLASLDRRRGFRPDLVTIVRSLGWSAEQQVLFLDPFLESAVGQVRCYAAEVFLAQGTNYEKIEASLLPLLRSDNLYDRAHALKLLARVASSPERIVDALEPWLDGDVSPEFRWPANSRPDQVECVAERLLNMAGNDDRRRFRAAMLLEYASSDHFISILRSLLGSSDLGLRFRAAQFLSADTPRDSIHIALEPLLVEDDLELRLGGIRHLIGLDFDKSRLMAALEPMLLVEEPFLLCDAVEQAQRLSVSSAQLARCAHHLLKSDFDRHRARGLELLLNSGDLEFSVVEQMVKAVQRNPNESVAACRRVWDRPSLSESDGMVLADLVRRKVDDDWEQQRAREVLFDWLNAKLRIQSAGR